MKTVGILGGLGPDTTAKFYLDIVAHCFEVDETQRPPILIWSVPSNFEVEKDYIDGKVTGKYIEYLQHGAKVLEQGGADFIVIPCNTLHMYIDHVKSAVNIPVVNMVEKVVDYLIKNNIMDVGILATKQTIKSGIYRDLLIEQSIVPHYVDTKDQDIVNDVIVHILEEKHTESDTQAMISIVEKLKEKKVENILLACTDLQLILHQKDVPLKLHDTLRILTEATVEEVFKE